MTEITLTQLLDSRDARQQKQKELLRRYSRTLVCLTVVFPGSVKRTENSLIVANAAMAALQQCRDCKFTVIEEHDLDTGFEGYLLSPLSAKETKRITCELEECHPLGRLFDIDVITPECIPIKREDVGFAPRRCLLCDNEVRYCMRNKTHTQKELLSRINEIVDEYQQ